MRCVLIALLALTSSIPATLYAQEKKVMLLLVQYSDHATNPLARGGRGWIDTNQDRIPDIPLDSKYRWKDYYNIFFGTTHSPHRDSIDYSAMEIAADARVGHKMEMLTGVRGYYREVSYGESDIVPATDFLDLAVDSPRVAGLWNHLVYNDSAESKDSSAIVWLTLDSAASLYHDNYEVSNNALNKARSLAIQDSGLYPHPDSLLAHGVSIVVLAAGISQGTAVSESGAFPERIRMSVGDADSNSVLIGPGILAHELGHRLYNFTDRNDRSWPSDHLIVGSSHWDVMGEMHGLTSFIPAHLNPFDKIKMGWIGYQRVLGAHVRQILPPVEQLYGGQRPWVYVLPVKGQIVGTSWLDTYENEFYIVENRRPIGFDKYILHYDKGDTVGGPYGTQDANMNGGYLIWHYTGKHKGSATGKVLTVVEADSRYDMLAGERYGSPADLFTGGILGDWTSPNTYSTLPFSSFLQFETDPSRTLDGGGSGGYNLGKNVHVDFGTYRGTGTADTLALISSGENYTPVYEATKGSSQHKLAILGTSMVLAYAHEGRVYAALSSNSGATWHATELLSEVRYAGVTMHIDHPAAFPSVIAGDSCVYAVWQEKASPNGSSYKLLFRRLLCNDTTVTEILDSLNASTSSGPDGIKPVIAVCNIGGNKEIVVVYQGPDGLYRTSRAEVAGSWSTPTKILSTFATSANPSLAATTDHEVLAYEDANQNDASRSDIFLMKDGGAAKNITGPFPKSILSCNHPSLSASGDNIMLTWESERKYSSGGMSSVVRWVPSHAVLHVDSLINSIPFTVSANRWNRIEIAQAPAISRIGTANQPLKVTVIWSAADDEGGNILAGRRLRFTEFERRNDVYAWWTNSKESDWSTATTRHPALLGIDGDARYVVTRGDTIPYALFSKRIGEENDWTNRWSSSPYTTLDISITNQNTAARMASITVGRPLLLDYQLQPVAELDMLGLPVFGFNGQSGGRTLGEITCSDTVTMMQDDVIRWELLYVRDSVYANNDTVSIQALMKNPSNGNFIGSSGIVKMPGQVMDSSFTLSLELPQAYAPAANVQVELNITGGAIDDQERFLSLMVTNYDEESAPKRRAESTQERRLPTAPLVRMSPQPATDYVKLTYTQSDGDVHDCIVTTTLGQEVLRASGTTGDGMKNMTLDVRSLPAGVYIYTLPGVRNTRTGSFVIVK